MGLKCQTGHATFEDDDFHSTELRVWVFSRIVWWFVTAKAPYRPHG
jgi:hypothetical protein